MFNYSNAFERLGFTPSQAKAAVGVLDLLEIPGSRATFETLDQALASLKDLTQAHCKRNKEGPAGLEQSGWVERKSESAERWGVGDGGRLLAKKEKLLQLASEIGLTQALVPSAGPNDYVISLGATASRVEERLRFVTGNYPHHPRLQIYATGGDRLLDPNAAGEKAMIDLLKKNNLPLTEHEMVKIKMGELGFDLRQVISVVARPQALRATTVEDAKEFLSASHFADQPNPGKIIPVSNAPYSRRQAMDIFKSILAATGQVAEVLPCGAEFSSGAPLYNLIEELTFMVNSGVQILELAKAKGLTPQVQAALASIVQAGVPLENPSPFARAHRDDSWDKVGVLLRRLKREDVERGAVKGKTSQDDPSLPKAGVP